MRRTTWTATCWTARSWSSRAWELRSCIYPHKKAPHEGRLPSKARSAATRDVSQTLHLPPFRDTGTNGGRAAPRPPRTEAHWEAPAWRAPVPQLPKCVWPSRMSVFYSLPFHAVYIPPLCACGCFTLGKEGLRGSDAPGMMREYWACARIGRQTRNSRHSSLKIAAPYTATNRRRQGHARSNCSNKKKT